MNLIKILNTEIVFFVFFSCAFSTLTEVSHHFFHQCNSPSIKITLSLYPSGVLDDETPSALALAQTVRSLVTKASVNRWFPRATEQMIRDSIVDQRAVMMSQGENDVHNTIRLAELTQNLQVIHKRSL